MKVLVIGATGFIGFPVAQALVRGGHIVYGLARSQAKGQELAKEEIIPVIGDVDSDTWIPLIATLDVIIDAVGGMDVKNLSASMFERVIKAVKELRPQDAPLLSYIYTSGVWVHGDNRKDIVTDTTPIVRPVELVAWRPAFEQLIVRSTAINGIVIRPALLYGRSASVIGMLFEAAAAGNVAWPGTPGGRYAVIHSDDLSDVYLRVAEKAPVLGGKIFDAANPYTESVDDLLEKLVKISGAKGPYEYTKPAHLFEEAIQSTTLIRPYLANALLDWSAKKPGLIDGLENYYAAWLALSA
ncbi:hypothetical protein B0H11DRAFT_2189154 [Mycena galericulata]|nr:hypothetical protein B0H11DRAFT_2189154 [Mycena galericulata]